MGAVALKMGAIASVSRVGLCKFQLIQPASNPERPRACCSVIQSEQHARAVCATAVDKANPKVGLVTRDYLLVGFRV